MGRGDKEKGGRGGGKMGGRRGEWSWGIMGQDSVIIFLLFRVITPVYTAT